LRSYLDNSLSEAAALALIQLARREFHRAYRLAERSAEPLLLAFAQTLTFYEAQIGRGASADTLREVERLLRDYHDVVEREARLDAPDEARYTDLKLRQMQLLSVRDQPESSP